MEVKNIAIHWIYHGSVQLWFTKVLQQPKRLIIVEDRCFSNEKIDRVKEVALKKRFDRYSKNRKILVCSDDK